MNFISFFKALWTNRIFTIPALTLVTGVAAGYRLKHCDICAPTVVAKKEDHKAEDQKKDVAGMKDLGSKDVVTKKYAPPSPGCPSAPLESRLIEETTVHQDPIKITQNTTVDTHKIEDAKSSVVTTVLVKQSHWASLEWVPQVRPGFETGSVAGGLRLTDDLWLKASVQPHNSFSPDHWSFGVGIQVFK